MTQADDPQRPSPKFVKWAIAILIVFWFLVYAVLVAIWRPNLAIPPDKPFSHPLHPERDRGNRQG